MKLPRIAVSFNPINMVIAFGFFAPFMWYGSREWAMPWWGHALAFAYFVFCQEKTHFLGFARGRAAASARLVEEMRTAHDEAIKLHLKTMRAAMESCRKEIAALLATAPENMQKAMAELRADMDKHMEAKNGP